ncbi:class I SAM-dependent methyltransferase [Nitrospiraceae bacterium AH_259_D15_M11_P09]|nr:class I SAM-dependent methyltransferase [Nitrospiraceae bacterium AH_259_D15_M11_P09]
MIENFNRTFFSSNFCVRKYAEERNSLDDLFSSERYFLDRILKPGMRVLDIGCAGGGLYAALRQLTSDVNYVGVDIAPKLIEQAQRRFPDAQFMTLDATEPLPFAPDSFDLILMLGVALHESAYRNIIFGTVGLTRHYFLYDVHLKRYGTEEITDIEKACVVNRAGMKNRYIVTPYWQFRVYLENLRTEVVRIEVCGYYSTISANKKVKLPFEPDRVMTACVLLERRRGNDSPQIWVETLPWEEDFEQSIR